MDVSVDAAGSGGDARDARARLVEGMVAAVADKGYPATTIADVVAHARVSRRTFYEEFADKDECLAACHAVMGDHMLDAITAVPGDGVGPRAHVEAVVRALVAALAGRPNYTYAHFLTLHAAGPRARQARRDVQTRIAGALRDLAARQRTEHAEISVPSAMMATALIGGIAELIVQALERGRIDWLHEITPTVTDLISAVLLAR